MSVSELLTGVVYHRMVQIRACACGSACACGLVWGCVQECWYGVRGAATYGLWLNNTRALCPNKCVNSVELFCAVSVSRGAYSAHGRNSVMSGVWNQVKMRRRLAGGTWNVANAGGGGNLT